MSELLKFNVNFNEKSRETSRPKNENKMKMFNDTISISFYRARRTNFKMAFSTYRLVGRVNENDIKYTCFSPRFRCEIFDFKNVHTHARARNTCTIVVRVLRDVEEVLLNTLWSAYVYVSPGFAVTENQ